MSMNKPEIKFSDKEDKATIVYQTNEGSVMVEFYQKPKKSVDISKSSGPADYTVKDITKTSDLIAKVSIKKTGKLFKDIFMAQKQVYSSFKTNDIDFIDYNQSTGSLDFFKNLEETQFSHENADVLKLINRAQQDVVAQIPNEQHRRYEAYLAKEAAENAKIDADIEKRAKRAEKLNQAITSVKNFFGIIKNQRSK